MAGHLGEVHEGVISGITNWGMYVELPNTCEGMIRLQNMNDYYIFDENKYELRGEMDRQTFRLGQKVKIYIADADKAARTVDRNCVRHGKCAGYGKEVFYGRFRHETDCK